jgi:hypothetical protein
MVPRISNISKLHTALSDSDIHTLPAQIDDLETKLSNMRVNLGRLQGALSGHNAAALRKTARDGEESLKVVQDEASTMIGKAGTRREWFARCPKPW